MEEQTGNEIMRVLSHMMLCNYELQIVSGEGEQGTVEDYDGRKSVVDIQRRLKEERCDGDRWAFVQTEDGYMGWN